MCPWLSPFHSTVRFSASNCKKLGCMLYVESTEHGYRSDILVSVSQTLSIRYRTGRMRISSWSSSLIDLIINNLPAPTRVRLQVSDFGSCKTINIVEKAYRRRT